MSTVNVHGTCKRGFFGRFLEAIPLIQGRTNQHHGQVTCKKGAVSQSSASMSEQAGLELSSSMSTAQCLRLARKSTQILPARNLVGRNKTRATGGALPRSRFARPCKL